MTTSSITLRGEARTRLRTKAAFRARRSPRTDGFRDCRQALRARFVVLRSGLARLERALAQFMLDLRIRRSMVIRKLRRRSWCAMTPCSGRRSSKNPPTVCLPAQGGLASRRFAELAKQGSAARRVRECVGPWLIPTAEVPLTNLVRERIIDEDVLPMRFTALHAASVPKRVLRARTPEG